MNFTNSRTFISLLLVVALIVLRNSQSIASTAALAESRRPNILLIVADDHGYYDLGSFGSEIQTVIFRVGVLLCVCHACP